MATSQQLQNYFFNIHFYYYITFFLLNLTSYHPFIQRIQYIKYLNNKMKQKIIQEQSQQSVTELLNKQKQINNENIDTPEDFYPQDRYRYINLIIFLIAAIVNSIPNQTFTAINTRIVSLYNSNKIIVAMNTLIFPIAHPILAFFANGILDKYGLYVGCATGAILMIIGSWLRFFINQSIWFTLIGSLIAAAGNIFIIDSPSKLANTWFKPKDVPFVTTLGVLANLLSNSVSLILPSLFVSIHSNKQDIKFMIMMEAIIISVPMFIVLVFFRSKPKQPPSFAAAVKHEQNYISDLKTLFLSKNYLLLLLTMSMSFGTLTALLTDIQYIILPFRYINTIGFSSNLLLTASLAGGLGCMLFIRLLKIHQKYKLLLFIALLGTTLQMIMIPFSFQINRQWIAYVNIGFLGFFIIPVTPIIMQFGCQIAFPIGQASSSGFLLAGGQLFGFLVGAGFLSLLDGINTWKVYLVCGCFAAFQLIGIISLYFVVEDLRRRKYEQLSVKLSLGDVTKEEKNL